MEPPRPRLWLAFPRAVLLSLVSTYGGGVLAVCLACARARAWTLLQLGLAAFAIGVACAIVLLLGVRRSARAASILCVLALARLAVAVLPLGLPERPGAPVKTATLDADRGRTPWFARLPERELVALGSSIGLSQEERAANTDRGLFRDAYDEIERVGPFERPEPHVIDSWLLDRGHYWVCAAEGSAPRPLLVFLHGHGGNCQVYPAWLAPPARLRGIATAFPSCGFGFWNDARSRIPRVVDRVARDLPIDRARVFLCGLSAGAHGAFEAFEADPSRYAGVISISGAIPPALDVPAFRGKRVLFVHGTLDPRTPFAGARRAADVLRSAGVDVTLVEHEGGDHFILMNRRDAVVRTVLDWIERHR